MGVLLYSGAVFISILATCCAELDPERHPAWGLLDHRTCGLTKSSRIIGGYEAKVGQFPWLVQIGTIGRTLFGKIELFYCGGSIISPLYVLSAAHCIPVQNKRAMNAVKAGEHNLNTIVDCDENECAPPPQNRRIANIIVHPLYNNPKTQNDIIVIQLNHPFDFNDYVRHICLCPRALVGDTFSHMNAQVAGWGVFDMDMPSQSHVLRATSLKVWSNVECAPIFSRFVKLSPGQMCVGGEIGKDSCSGDSGGPLMKTIPIAGPPRVFIIGIVSLGFTKCAETPNPGIYTRVNHFQKWILDMIILLEQTKHYTH